ncbi:PREDICTED: mitochondrial protein import protein ZIM17-like [Ceratosolen solmsi marchali]|uniref:Mitochondrial protein import protein ZIM17-like n=1 Tax=Ceratosolen solmsi marchali TaxID=326594 RepID=A0AAJ7E3H3_9HYME|nr:PREDICTED: mitochondrial protein import protein ZIM17-like [Ceratosolen solmsi marchali]
MFLSRQILNHGFRILLKRLPNTIGIQNVHNKVIFLQHSNFSLSRRSLLEANSNILSESDNSNEVEKQKLGQIKAKLKIVFTCKKCNIRSSKIISKLAYEKGVVIVRCDKCKNNHLIADNLGWFDNNACRNIETILRKKGEEVRKIQDDQEGYFEAIANETFKTVAAIRNEAIDKKIIEEDNNQLNVQSENIENYKNK